MSKKKYFYILGIILLLSALVFNQFTLQLYTDDGKIGSNDIIFILWSFDIFSLLVSFIIFYKKGDINFSIKIMFLIIIQAIVVIIMLEISLRAYIAIKHQFKPPEMNFNEVIGWQNTPNLYEHETYKLWGEVIYTTHKYGFRIFGDPNSSKIKIFIIGDSFTMAGNINDGKAYYDYLRSNDDIELFVYGGGGYGNLQEYLILDKYYDEINPDLIIWQFCDNDLINNDNKLEGRSLIHSGIDPRPYYIDNSIKVLTPWRRHNKFYNFFHKSLIVKILSLELKLIKNDNLVTIEKVITEDDPLYINSANTTEKIMQLVIERINGRPLITFNARIYQDFPEWWSDTFRNIALQNNFIYLSQITDSLTSAIESGIKIDGSPKDKHWNQKGHEIVGKLLLDYLEKNYLK